MSVRFQNPASPLMDAIVDFHNDIQFYLIVILVFVGWLLASIVITFGFGHTVTPHSDENDSEEGILASRELVLTSRGITHYTSIEIIWTTIPVFVLIAIAIPSFSLLFALDYQPRQPGLTVKIIGHQWYWTYELSNYLGRGDKLINMSFDSYMVPESDLEFGRPRLLTVDRQLVLPAQTHIRLLVTSTDVIHSWAVPAFGIKIDCIPGRLNQASLYVVREGTFYGQCSELCGVNHGFMPIEVSVVPPYEWFHFYHFDLTSKRTVSLPTLGIVSPVDKVRQNEDKLPLLRQTNPLAPWSFDHTGELFTRHMRRMELMEYFRRGLWGQFLLWKQKFEYTRTINPIENYDGQPEYLFDDFEVTNPFDSIAKDHVVAELGNLIDKDQLAPKISVDGKPIDPRVGSWVEVSKSEDFDLAGWVGEDHYKKWLVASFRETLIPTLYKNFSKLEFAKTLWGWFPYFYGTNKVLNWQFSKIVEKHEKQVYYHTALAQHYVPGTHSIPPVTALREPHRLSPAENAIRIITNELGKSTYNNFTFPFKLFMQFYSSLSSTASDKPGLKPATSITPTGDIIDEIRRSKEQKVIQMGIDIRDAILRDEAARIASDEAIRKGGLAQELEFLSRGTMISFLPSIGPLDKPASTLASEQIVKTMSSLSTMTDNEEIVQTTDVIVTPLNAGQMLESANKLLENLDGVCLKRQNGLSLLFYEVLLGPVTILQIWLVTEGEQVIGAYKRLYDFRTVKSTYETCLREGVGTTAKVALVGTPTHRTEIAEALNVENAEWALEVAKTTVFYTVVAGGAILAFFSYFG